MNSDPGSQGGAPDRKESDQADRKSESSSKNESSKNESSENGSNGESASGRRDESDSNVGIIAKSTLNAGAATENGRGGDVGGTSAGAGSTTAGGGSGTRAEVKSVCEKRTGVGQKLNRTSNDDGTKRPSTVMAKRGKTKRLRLLRRI